MKEESVQFKLNEYFARKSAVKSNLIIATVLSVVGIMLTCVAAHSVATIVMKALLLVFLWIVALCFFKHNVNGMQCALGAFLGSQILFFTYVTSNIGWGVVLPLAFSVLAFITHQYLIAKRQSKSNALYHNQLVGALFMLACVVNVVVSLVTCGFKHEAMIRIFGDLFTAAAMNMIITIETRINEYKLQRDALTTAGKWNDGAKAKLKKEIFD